MGNLPFTMEDHGLVDHHGPVKGGASLKNPFEFLKVGRRHRDTSPQQGCWHGAAAGLHAVRVSDGLGGGVW